MVNFITYGTYDYHTSMGVCVDSAERYGADKTTAFTPCEIDNEFYEKNKEILQSPRGGGYWLWKPYFINKVINELSDGDILIYCDAGVEIIADLKEIIKVMGDVFLFSNGHQQADWCKADVMQKINGGIVNHSFEQVQATVIFLRVGDYTRNFVKEWLELCQVPGFVGDSDSELPNDPQFREHRHDQAVLSCLAIREGIKLHYWADSLWFSTQRYRWPEDRYPLMFKHHRKRNSDY